MPVDDGGAATDGTQMAVAFAQRGERGNTNDSVDVLDGVTAVTGIDFNAQANLDIIDPLLDADDIIAGAVGSVLDNSNLMLLSENTTVSISSEALPQINAADDTTGDVKVTVSTIAGTLTPGTTITVTAQEDPQGVAESVTVPVLNDGSFTASIRATPGTELTISQFPTSNDNDAELQIKELEVPEINASATFDGTVPTLLTSSLIEGQIVVLFDTPATSNFTFADVASTATVNGAEVTALGDKFAAVVSTTDTYTLAVTVDGSTVSTTLDVTTTDKTKNGRIRALRSLKTDKNGRYVLRQRNGRLPNDLNLEIVYDDGTTAVVNNADLTRNRRGVVKFDNPESDKTISFVQLLSAKRGSRVAQ